MSADTVTHKTKPRGKTAPVEQNKTKTLPRSRRIKGKVFHLAVASKKEGSVSGDEEAKRRSLKRLAEDKGHQRANRN